MTLVYDGLAERIRRADNKTAFCARNVSVAKPGLLHSPCGVCPLINECSSEGLFTPTNCEIMSEWIEKQRE